MTINGDRLPENRALLDAYRRADPEAFERLYHSYVSEVASLLRRGFQFSSEGRQLQFVGYDHPDDLQDALQETFLLAFDQSARRGYNGLNPFGNYVLGIARNVVLGRFRKDLSRLSCFKSLEPIDAENSDQAAVSAGLSSAAAFVAPDKATSNSEIRKLMQSFVSQLTEQQKQIVKYYFIDHLSQESTAEKMDLNRNRVRKQIRSIRRKLWRRIRKEGLDKTLPLSFEVMEVK